MKQYKLAITAVALAIFAGEQTARASLVVEATGTGDLVFGATSFIPVNYDVVFDTSSSLYTYLYQFTPLEGYNIGQFTINAEYVNSVLALNTLISGTPYDLTGSITAGGTSSGNVSWVWSPYTPQTQLVGFTSYFGPAAGDGSLNGDASGPWGDNPGSGGTFITVPDPAVVVPESPTVIAAILVVLPFGARVLRDMRQKRLIG